MDVFFEQSGIPTNSCLLLDTREEAAGFPVGDLSLGVCPACGFLSNVVFEEAEYSSRYEETQGFSKLFVDWAKSLARRWVEKYDLAGRSVLEIGCGKGEFLTWMVEAGAGSGIGIDPGVHPERIDSPMADRLTWIADFYSEAYSHLAADAVVCRHTLEHIAPVGEVMAMVRRAIGDRLGTVVLFELPDVKRVLEEVAFWDVYHEHCSYFSLGSLARLFRRSGFEVLHLEADYDDQYLLIEARPSPTTPAPGDPFPVEDDLELLTAAVDKYHVEVAALRASWRARLGDLRDRGGRAVIWGAGSKGVSFLTNLGLRDEVRYAVDINPYKTGKFMAGTGHEIVAPEFLVEYGPDLVVAMNPIYLAEIRAKLDSLGLHPDLIGA
jgi:hypothetical protein